MNTITALRIAFMQFVQSFYSYLLSSHWVLKLLGDPDKGKLGSALWGSTHGGELSQDLEVAMAHTGGRAETEVTGWALRRGGRQTAANWRAFVRGHGLGKSLESRHSLTGSGWPYPHPLVEERRLAWLGQLGTLECPPSQHVALSRSL